MGLSYTYLDPDKNIGSESFAVSNSFLRATGRTQIGWHYRVDLAWILETVRYLPAGVKILDAGGGLGPTQFLLAELGHDIFNIDLFHTEPPYWMRKRYGISVESLLSFSRTDYSDHIEGLAKKSIRTVFSDFLRKSRPFASFQSYRKEKNLHRWRKNQGLANRPVGTIKWLQGNLAHIPEIAAESFDCVVSLSAIEHIPMDILSPAMAELKRVTKKEACWAVTTSSTEKAETWWHGPSKGHCFSAADLEHIFHAKPDHDQNPSEVLLKYKENKYLQKTLADFYFRSGDNGMPWGRWDPEYIPVGIFDRRYHL